MGAIDHRMKREIRAREAFVMYANRSSYVAKNDIDWYISNRATKQEMDSVDRRNASQVKRDEKAEDKRLKREERNKWIRSIIKRLMDGLTIEEVAKEVDRSVPTIYKLISSYEDVDPEFVSEYRRIARTHRFGRFSHQKDE